MQFCWFMLGLPVSLALLVEFKKIWGTRGARTNGCLVIATLSMSRVQLLRSVQRWPCPQCFVKVCWLKRCMLNSCLIESRLQVETAALTVCQFCWAVHHSSYKHRWHFKPDCCVHPRFSTVPKRINSSVRFRMILADPASSRGKQFKKMHRFAAALNLGSVAATNASKNCWCLSCLFLSQYSSRYFRVVQYVYPSVLLLTVVVVVVVSCSCQLLLCHCTTEPLSSGGTEQVLSRSTSCPYDGWGAGQGAHSRWHCHVWANWQCVECWSNARWMALSGWHDWPSDFLSDLCESQHFLYPPCNRSSQGVSSSGEQKGMQDQMQPHVCLYSWPSFTVDPRRIHVKPLKINMEQ